MSITSNVSPVSTHPLGGACGLAPNTIGGEARSVREAQSLSRPGRGWEREGRVSREASVPHCTELRKVTNGPMET